jgi:hypothetical protein
VWHLNHTLTYRFLLASTGGDMNVNRVPAGEERAARRGMMADEDVKIIEEGRCFLKLY